MNIFLDGPEKSGKSTLAKELERTHGATVRKWGPITHHSEYADPLRHDLIESGRHLVVWDRAWPSEHVYAKLMNRPRDIAADPWILEWDHGRAAQPFGVRLMMIGPADYREQEQLRDDTDLPVDVQTERYCFTEYARWFGWPILHGFTRNVPRLAKVLADMAASYWKSRPGSPPGWAGPANAEVVMLADATTAKKQQPYCWLPFSGRKETTIGRMMGLDAFKVAWCVAGMVDPLQLKGRHIFVFGKDAQRWLAYYVTTPASVTKLDKMSRISNSDVNEIALAALRIIWRNK